MAGTWPAPTSEKCPVGAGHVPALKYHALPNWRIKESRFNSGSLGAFGQFCPDVHRAPTFAHGRKLEGLVNARCRRRPTFGRRPPNRHFSGRTPSKFRSIPLPRHIKPTVNYMDGRENHINGRGKYISLPSAHARGLCDTQTDFPIHNSSSELGNSHSVSYRKTRLNLTRKPVAHPFPPNSTAPKSATQTAPPPLQSASRRL